MEITDNKRKDLKPEFAVEKHEVKDLITGINRCVKRLDRLVELHAPLSIIKMEVAMIQYRALKVKKRRTKMVSPGDIQEAEKFGYPRVEDQLADTNEKRHQCEGCLGYDEKELFASLCGDCQDKAASYDITESKRKQLCKAIKDVLPQLEEESYKNIGEIIGRLRTALNNCRFKEGEQ